jgi:hypothetical protein
MPKQARTAIGKVTPTSLSLLINMASSTPYVIVATFSFHAGFQLGLDPPPQISPGFIQWVAAPANVAIRPDQDGFRNSKHDEGARHRGIEADVLALACPVMV